MTVDVGQRAVHMPAPERSPEPEYRRDPSVELVQALARLMLTRYPRWTETRDTRRGMGTNPSRGRESGTSGSESARHHP